MINNQQRERAYSLWEQAGRPEGMSDHFWELAGNQLLAERFDVKILPLPPDQVIIDWLKMDWLKMDWPKIEGPNISMYKDGKSDFDFPDTEDQKNGVDSIHQKYPWLKRKSKKGTE